MNKSHANLRKCDQRYLQRQLLASVRSLKKFMDPENEGCSVDPKVRKAASLYLHSWVYEPLEDLLLWSHGERATPRYLSDSEGKIRRQKLGELLDDI
jgi:hypothetical protein